MCLIQFIFSCITILMVTMTASEDVERYTYDAKKMLNHNLTYMNGYAMINYKPSYVTITAPTDMNLTYHRTVEALVFLPPASLGRDLCITPTNTTLAGVPLPQSSGIDISLAEKRDIALLVANTLQADTNARSDDGVSNFTARCSCDTKAENAALLNQYYAMHDGPRIKYLIDDYIISSSKRSECLMKLSQKEVRQYGMHVVFGVQPYPFADYLLSEMKSRLKIEHVGDNVTFDIYLTREAFLPFSDDNWTTTGLIISFLPLPMMAYPKLLMTLVIIFFAILSIIILRASIGILMYNKRLIPRQNQRGWIIGITIERIERNEYNDFFPVLVRGRDNYNNNNIISIAEVEELPLVKYNVTNLKGVAEKYSLNKIKDGDDKEKDSEKFSLTMIEKEDDEEIDSDDEKEEKDGDDDVSEAKDTEQGCSTSNIHKNEDQNFDRINVAYSSCNMCSVCLTDFVQGEEVRLLPKCFHLFHHDCLVPWLTSKNNLCPLCLTVVEINQHRHGDHEYDNYSMNVLHDDNMTQF